LLDKTLRTIYIFEWGHKKENAAWALGTSHVHHSYRSNANMKWILKEKS